MLVFVATLLTIADALPAVDCDQPFPVVEERVFLAMTEEEQFDVLMAQARWMNACLASGDDTPPSLN